MDIILNRIISDDALYQYYESIMCKGFGDITKCKKLIKN